MKLSLAFVTALIASVASVTVAVPTESAPRSVIDINRRAPASLEDALADIAKTKKKIYTAMQNVSRHGVGSAKAVAIRY